MCSPVILLWPATRATATAERLGLRPDLIVGDFDSAPQPKTDHETIVLPHVKDDTDTQYAAHWLLEHGYDEITLLGALGGARLEHTLANLSTGLGWGERGGVPTAWEDGTAPPFCGRARAAATPRRSFSTSPLSHGGARRGRVRKRLLL